MNDRCDPDHGEVHDAHVLVASEVLLSDVEAGVNNVWCVVGALLVVGHRDAGPHTHAAEFRIHLRQHLSEQGIEIVVATPWPGEV